MTVWPGAARFELVGQGQGLSELRADLHPGADLLGEDRITARVLQRLQLAGKLLGRGRTPGVPDPDRHGALDTDRRFVRCRADHPRLAGPAVGGDGDVEIFAKRGHEGEAGRVVLERGLAAAGAARTPTGAPHLGQSWCSVAFAA